MSEALQVVPVGDGIAQGVRAGWVVLVEQLREGGLFPEGLTVIQTEQCLTWQPWRAGEKESSQRNKKEGTVSMFSPGSAVTQQGKIIALSVHLHFFDLSCNPLLGIAVKTTLLEKKIYWWANISCFFLSLPRCFFSFWVDCMFCVGWK